VMCADGMTEARVIASNKFAVDCLLANINMSVLFLYLLFVRSSRPPFPLWACTNHLSKRNSCKDRHFSSPQTLRCQ
jgi:hypothetical protein